jgi:oligoendopeptidase F
VTAEALNEIYIGLVKDYHGPAYAVDPDDPVEWAYIPHFYWKYYVFNYATGLASGIALAERMLTGGDEERAAYLGMLQAGSSAPPLALLRGAGVDLTRPEAITAALELFDATVARLEELVLSGAGTTSAP